MIAQYSMNDGSVLCADRWVPSVVLGRIVSAGFLSQFVVVIVLIFSAHFLTQHGRFETR